MRMPIQWDFMNPVCRPFHQDGGEDQPELSLEVFVSITLLVQW